MDDEVESWDLTMIKTRETEDYSAMYSVLLSNGYPLVVDMPIEETMKHIKRYLEEK